MFFTKYNTFFSLFRQYVQLKRATAFQNLIRVLTSFTLKWVNAGIDGPRNDPPLKRYSGPWRTSFRIGGSTKMTIKCTVEVIKCTVEVFLLVSCVKCNSYSHLIKRTSHWKRTRDIPASVFEILFKVQKFWCVWNN